MNFNPSFAPVQIDVRENDEVSIPAPDTVVLVIHAAAAVYDVQIDTSMEVNPRVVAAVFRIKHGDNVDYTIEFLGKDDTVFSERHHENASVGVDDYKRI
ncbi:hypothetical protein CF327_g2862 [Tilletia walkeri]|uniref:Uncharacterized protein n=1 Tax=Tilletia indica TaxID=43049 RepID=A0A177T8X1_9BASI|nr:hypothetical protein CF327_g2862 [Tilletia walkeri]KAE8229182.1 hypothetical protein CF326_g5852 [Tilletia indica]KAE8244032.1 hypothetical protein A4X13_0g6847 [Tilletia indica]